MGRPEQTTSHVRYALELAFPFLLAAVVLLPLLGHRPLTAWDEGIYAEISREMVQGHGWQAWWVPHWNGQLWFEKPPLALWLTAVSLRLFGITTWAARLPSALAGVALTAVLYTWLRRRSGTATAMVGSFLLVSGFGFQHAARAGETDTLLSLFCFVSVVGLSRLLDGDRRGWLLFWLGWALAAMTKGAASITLPLTALILLVTDRQRLLRFRTSFGFGLLLFLGFVLPWHLAMAVDYGQAFTNEYLGLHVLHRASTAIEGHRTGPFFFLWVLLLSCFPFALLFPAALAAGLRSRDQPQSVPLRPVAVFALVTLLGFSAARTRLPHYIAPIYAPLAAMSAIWLVPRLRLFVQHSRGRQLSTALALLTAYAGGAVLTSPGRRALHSPRLPDGRLTPDNRETAALLEQGAPLLKSVPGPLLLWRLDPETPMTTAAFYSQHLVEQVVTEIPSSAGIRDRYTFAPVLLEAAMQAKGPAAPRPILLDCSLVPSLPAPYGLRVLAAGPDQLLALLAPSTQGRPVREVLCPYRAHFGEKVTAGKH